MGTRLIRLEIEVTYLHVLHPPLDLKCPTLERTLPGDILTSPRPVCSIDEANAAREQLVITGGEHVDGHVRDRP